LNNVGKGGKKTADISQTPVETLLRPARRAAWGEIETFLRRQGVSFRGASRNRGNGRVDNSDERKVGDISTASDRNWWRKAYPQVGKVRGFGIHEQGSNSKGVGRLGEAGRLVGGGPAPG